MHAMKKKMMLKWNLWDVIGYVCLDMNMTINLGFNFNMSSVLLLQPHLQGRSDQQYSLEKEDYYKIISSTP